MTHSFTPSMNGRFPAYQPSDAVPDAPGGRTSGEPAADLHVIEPIEKGLLSCNQDLLSLNSSSEDDFLAIGAHLREVSHQASEIAAMASSASGIVGGTELEGYIGALQEIFDQMDKHLRVSGKRLGDNDRTLGTIVTTVDDIAASLTGFKGIVKRLRILSVSMKIESSRLGTNDSSFSAIAEDVDKLATLIETKSEGIYSATGSLRAVVGQTLSKASAFHAHGDGQARTILDGIIGSLSSLSEKHSLSSTTACGIASRSEAILKSVGEIVSSLQFHDITRQQIEHVIEVLDGLHKSISTMGEGGYALSRIEDLYVGDVCEIQVRQLSNAKLELVSAAGGAQVSLREIADNVKNISQEVASLISTADVACGSFLSGLESEVAGIIASVGENGAATRELFLAVERVRATVSDLSAFVEGIEDVGLEIELIALNARVKAARSGIDGAALGVLAEAIRSLSEEALGRTTVISETLNHAARLAEALGGDHEDDSGITEFHEMVSRLTGLLNSSGELDKRIGALIAPIKAGSDALEAEIRTLVSQMTVHERTEDVLGKVISDLEGTIREVEKLGPPRETKGKAAYLKRFEDRYTMHKERSVHRSVVDAGALITRTVSDTSGGLGENVELF